MHTTLTPAQLAATLHAIQTEIDALERYATPEVRPDLERYYDELIAAQTELRYTYRKLNESERVSRADRLDKLRK